MWDYIIPTDYSCGMFVACQDGEVWEMVFPPYAEYELWFHDPYTD